MLTYLTRLRQREDGFTLIELMIVMVVLGILSGIVLFGIGTFRIDATAKAEQVNQRQCATALVAWEVNHDTPPTNEDLQQYFPETGAPGECP
jgi:general secretion pathway protein G